MACTAGTSRWAALTPSHRWARWVLAAKQRSGRAQALPFHWQGSMRFAAHQPGLMKLAAVVTCMVLPTLPCRLFAGHAGGGSSLWQLLCAAAAGGCRAGGLTALLQVQPAGVPVLTKVAYWLCMHAAAWHFSPLTACRPPCPVQVFKRPLHPFYPPSVQLSSPRFQGPILRCGGWEAFGSVGLALSVVRFDAERHAGPACCRLACRPALA